MRAHALTTCAAVITSRSATQKPVRASPVLRHGSACPGCGRTGWVTLRGGVGPAGITPAVTVGSALVGGGLATPARVAPGVRAAAGNA